MDYLCLDIRIASMKNTGIIDYGMGNIASVANALDHLGVSKGVVAHPDQLNEYERLILPGVGAFPMAMEELHKRGFVEPLDHIVKNGEKPVIGLCLGMQLLFDGSDEFGFHKGLGWIKGHVASLETEGVKFPVPHMGWNDATILQPSPLISDDMGTSPDFYFVHSFFCKAENRGEVVATVSYGVEMDVIVQKGRLFGCQFHPEKSQKNGLQLLKNFCSFN